ncbi:hypothetical protein H5410_043297 [Solanum commersonii]|uniref:Uncharacterized protein n=1 Tax=Solanum commersonii TaxID=4109 RepID=A0A9J5XYT3_SOLCO|nr:hypothetical protein H5410_043297 [Solanum commersonii]
MKIKERNLTRPNIRRKESKISSSKAVWRYKSELLSSNHNSENNNHLIKQKITRGNNQLLPNYQYSKNQTPTNNRRVLGSWQVADNVGNAKS